MGSLGALLKTVDEMSDVRPLGVAVFLHFFTGNCCRSGLSVFVTDSPIKGYVIRCVTRSSGKRIDPFSVSP